MVCSAPISSNFNNALRFDIWPVSLYIWNIITDINASNIGNFLYEGRVDKSCVLFFSNQIS